MQAESQRSDVALYFTLTIISVLLILIGFAPSFYLKAFIHAPVPPLSQLTIVHGAVFTAWLVLFVTQISLIAADKVALHRQLGIVGAVLFGAMLALGYSTAITAARLGHAPPGAPPPLAFLALPLMGITVTLILVVAALLNRRRADWHKRLMTAAMITLTPPGTARIMIPLGLAPQAIWIALGIIEMLLVVAALYDYRVHKRVHPAWWFAIVLAVILHIGVWWAFSSPAWLAFAKAVTQS